ncbi:MAG: YitT family protein [Tissierella sp.]|nr:YitT family protein [Tissierella sp.]
MKLKVSAKSFLIINLGLLITALGMYFFLIPAELAAGGVTGLAIIINNLLPQIPVGLIMIIFNIGLFTLAFIVIGKEFGGLTIYNSLLLSALIYILELVIPVSGPLIDDLLVNLIYGVLISSVGMAIIFNQNASTGGTDIIAMIISKFTHLNIGKSLLIADSIVAIGAITVLGIEVGLYSLLGILVNTTLIDKVIAGFNTKYQVAIISEKEDIISKFITEEMSRGVTLLYGAGGFSKNEKRVIHTVVPRSEYLIIRNKVMEVDPKAFIWVNLVNEVHGEGYTF